MATAGAIRRRTLTLVTIPFAHGPSLGTPLLLSPGFGKGNRCRDPPPDSGGDSLLTERIQGSLSDLAFIIPIFKPNYYAMTDISLANREYLVELAWRAPYERCTFLNFKASKSSNIEKIRTVVRPP